MDESIHQESVLTVYQNNDAIETNLASYQCLESLDLLHIDSGFVDITGKIFAKQFDSENRDAIRLGIVDKSGGCAFAFISNQKFVLHYSHFNVQKDVNIRLFGKTIDNEGLAIEAHRIDIIDGNSELKESVSNSRVELHLHTNMSASDGVSSIEDYCKLARSFGHNALAITDHDCVQAFQEVEKCKFADGLKIIYGCEFTVASNSLSNQESHLVALAKNIDGISDIYELVSHQISNTNKITYADIASHRANLLIGSGCYHGEVFQTALCDKKALKEAILFYDYIEVQPLGCYLSLAESGIATKEEIQEAVISIIKAAEELGKIVVATGDVHYALPEDKMIRDILIDEMSHQGSDHPLKHKDGKRHPHPDQHYRSTQEMLDEFAFLGEEKAREIVIENTKRISYMFQELHPLTEFNHVECSLDYYDDFIRGVCYRKAVELYSTNDSIDGIPTEILARLDDELSQIKNYSNALHYYYAYQISMKARKDGMIYASRGCVSASFVSYLMGIGGINPLPAHLYCPHCHHVEWPNDTSFHQVGYDLKEKVCPDCGSIMHGDGLLLSQETFLGHEGEKACLIDMTFPSAYCEKAKEYLRDEFGSNNVVRGNFIVKAGNAAAYYAKRHLKKPFNNAKFEYLFSKLCEIKLRDEISFSSLMILPPMRRPYDFCPIKTSENSSWAEMHFDTRYAIDRLVRLEIYGHEQLDTLSDMFRISGVALEDIPLNDEATWAFLSLQNAHPFGEKASSYPNKFLGIPELSTSFFTKAMELVQPKKFSDLITLIGLAHSCKGYEGNAEKLLEEGYFLDDLIGTRDDVYFYLRDRGLSREDAYRIMEEVRKGRGIKAGSSLRLLAKHDVPTYFIISCNRVAYLFPKANSAAYAKNVYYFAYFKLHHPLAFYAAILREEDLSSHSFVTADAEDDLQRMAEELKEKDVLDATGMKTIALMVEAKSRGINFVYLKKEESKGKQIAIDEKKSQIIMPFTNKDAL